MVKVLLSISAIIGLFACSNKEIPTDNHFLIKDFHFNEIQDFKQLKSSTISFSQVKVPNRIVLFDGAIIISEFQGDTLIHVIDEENLALKRSLALAGKGPGEVSRIWNLFPGIEDKYFWIYTPELKKISLFHEDSLKAVAEYYQRSKNSMAVQYAPTYHGNFIGVAADGDDKFILYSKEGGVLSEFGSRKNFPLDPQIPSNVRAYVYQATLKSSPDLSKFGMASLYGDIIEVLDLKDSSILSIRGPIHQIPEVEIDYSAGYPMGLLREHDKEVYCYLNCYLSDKYIYGLYSGDIRKEVQSNSLSTGKYIYQFNYTGELIASYELDKTIDDLAVNEELKILYGISNDENPALVKFNL